MDMRLNGMSNLRKPTRLIMPAGDVIPPVVSRQIEWSDGTDMTSGDATLLEWSNT